MSDAPPEHPLSLYQFIALDMDGRAAYLWQHGEYLTGSVEQFRSNFYALGSFFVEVELFDQGDAIAAVVPFTTGDRYERMVRHIQLDRLT